MPYLQADIPLNGVSMGEPRQGAAGGRKLRQSPGFCTAPQVWHAVSARSLNRQAGTTLWPTKTRRPHVVTCKDYHDSCAASRAMGSVFTNCHSTVRDCPGANVGFPFRQAGTLRKTSRIELEAQLIEAHARLQLVPPSEGVSRTATPVRLGSFEVLLIEPLRAPPASCPAFWLEFFDHDRQFSIDSTGDCGIEDAMTAAEEFIDRVTKLSENPHAWRRPT